MLLEDRLPTRTCPLKYRLINAVLCVLLLVSAVSKAHGADAFTLQLRWTPQAQFLGYYVADTLGMYEAEGLAVDIRAGGPDQDPLAKIRDGEADLAVEWLGPALLNGNAAVPVTNIAQIFQKSSLMLICHRENQIVEASDLVGKTISVWPGSSEIVIRNWIESVERTADVGGKRTSFVPQGDVLQSWKDPSIDCVSGTAYNEYWQLLDQGLSFQEVTFLRFEDLGLGVLEDGLYADERRLDDPEFVSVLTRFVRASIAGWTYAAERPTESVEILLQRFPELDRAEQQRMAGSVIPLLERENGQLGKLDIAVLDDRSALMGFQEDYWKESSGAQHKVWTHTVWRMLNSQENLLYSDEVLYWLEEILADEFFYLLDLIGTLAFGVAGFARAVERRYDFWGALMLTSLPAIGGGTLRDVIVGGDRHPPFIFGDPTYLYVVLGVVFVGSLINYWRRDQTNLAKRFSGVMLVIDTVGLAAFCIIGAKVAILGGLDWFWVPCLAAITCAGGGIMLDIVTGLEPRTFRGVIYEEIAILGGLILMAMLFLANYAADAEQFIKISLALTFALVFFIRVAVVVKGWSAPRLINHPKPIDDPAS